MIAQHCTPLKEQSSRLLKRAQSEGAIRPDVSITQVLTLVAGLPEEFRDKAGSSALLDVVVQGLKTR